MCCTIFLGYFFSGGYSAYVKQRKLEKERLEVSAELASIKSIQLELVRNSKLERKIIQIDKELDTLKADATPKGALTKKIFRALRLVMIVGLGVYMGLEPVVQMSPQVLWPLSFLGGKESTMAIQPWFVILVSSAAGRHVLRTLALLFYPASTLP